MTVKIETFIRDETVQASIKTPVRTRVVPMPQYAPTMAGILAASDFIMAVMRGGRHA